MPQTAPGERLRGRFPLGPNVARPAAPFVRLLRPRNQPRQRAGPRQDRARLAGQHRRDGLGAHRVPGRRRARVHRPRRGRRARRSRRCASSADSEQGESADATGYKGFYYHFLDMQTGRRAWQCELSTHRHRAPDRRRARRPRAYFDGDDADEREIRDARRRALRARRLALGARTAAPPSRTAGSPESGFLPYRWEGYDEALLLYVLGLGSPTHPLAAGELRGVVLAPTSGRSIYGIEFLYAGPLFIHQLSHVWIDFRGIQDALHARARHRLLREQPPRDAASSSSTRSATRSASSTTASAAGASPRATGPATGRRARSTASSARFYDYIARGAPVRPRRRHDRAVGGGRLAAVRARDRRCRRSRTCQALHIEVPQSVRLQGVVQPDLSGGDVDAVGWVSPYHFGINQGPTCS